MCPPLVQSCGWGVSARKRVSSGSCVPALKTAKAKSNQILRGVGRAEGWCRESRWSVWSTGEPALAQRGLFVLSKGKGKPSAVRTREWEELQMTYSLKQPVGTQTRGLKYELKDCARALRLDSTNTQLSPLAQWWDFFFFFSSTWSLRGESRNVGRNTPTADTSSQDVLIKWSVSATVQWLMGNSRPAHGRPCFGHTQITDWSRRGSRLFCAGTFTPGESVVARFGMIPTQGGTGGVGMNPS